MERRIADAIADWTGALALAGAGGFAGWSLTPGEPFAGAPLAGAAAAGLALGLIGLAVMRRAGTEIRRDFGFVPIDFAAIDGDAVAEADELLLDEPFAAPAGELLLDDPLGAPAANSRVLRLFAPQTLPVPGEMVERIESWLEDSRQRRGIVPPTVAPGHGPGSSPAAAALHAALADIRRSLG